MAVKLVDGMDRPVRRTKKAIREALKNTDLVQDVEEVISLSHFYGGTMAEDEIDVYDGRQTYDPQEIFEVDEVDEAVARFFELVQELDY